MIINKYDEKNFKIINARAGSPEGGTSENHRSIQNFHLSVDTKERYDFIKIDIDGGELSFLEASIDYINLHKPFIFCEIQEKNHDFIFHSLMDRGYTHETLRSRGLGEKNILFSPIL